MLNRGLTICCRHLSTERADIGSVFINPKVQKMLKEITRFDEKQIFTKRIAPLLKTPKLMFMTDEQLEKAKEEAYELARARLQMPPVMAADNKKPEILAKDEEIVGYSKFKIMFVDISAGYSNRNRLMSVREVDGTLRYPTHEERSRLNHSFYPGTSKSIDDPKLFQDEHLQRVLKRKDYAYILNRACIQYEPDDPRYVAATSKVYTHIDDKGDYSYLRSTRHFGPMSLYLAHEKRADRLILEMIGKGFVEDAAKLVKIYNTCHRVEFSAEDDDMTLLQNYSDNCSANKPKLDLALQQLRAKHNAKADQPETGTDAKEDENSKEE